MIGEKPLLSRQANEAFFIKLSQQTSTGNVFELPVGISPIPTFRKLTAQSSSAPGRILFDQLPNKINILTSDKTVLDEGRHFHCQPFYHILSCEFRKM